MRRGAGENGAKRVHRVSAAGKAFLPRCAASLNSEGAGGGAVISFNGDSSEKLKRSVFGIFAAL